MRKIDSHTALHRVHQLEAARAAPQSDRLWLTASFTVLLALIPMLLAVGLAWFTAGAST